MSEPVTRQEQLLSAIATGGDIISPVTREEMYLAYMAGDTSIVLPEPVTRKEQFLYQACMNGGGASGGNIYGVSWDMTASNKLTRTGASAGFADPVPCVNGVGGSSPFDKLMPWAGMQIVEDEIAGTMVAIPKFWYRITKTDGALSFEIADAATDGFYVSPAHMDRGDGKGERDVVYIGRYHCGGTTGKSVTGADPLTSMTRAQFREAFKAQMAAVGATGYSMQDYAMFWTVRMLMLVEYATWDFQGAIGYGCGNGGSLEKSGKTDSMPYHTGTVGETRETHCVGVQYRYIEDMWANVYEFIDGWYFTVDNESLADVYVTIDIEQFSDTEGGVYIGSFGLDTLSGFITDWAVSTTKGYDWALIPASATDTGIEQGNEYVADVCVFVGPALCSGGAALEPSSESGPFFLFGRDADLSEPFFGARLQKIP